MSDIPQRILHVEDQPVVAKVMRRLVEAQAPEGLELVQAPSLASAISALQSKPYDVVLLDLELPDSSGLETLTRVREVAPTIPIVVLTGTENSEVGLTALELGAQEYLVKTEVTTKQLWRGLLFAIKRAQRDRQPPLAAQSSDPYLPSPSSPGAGVQVGSGAQPLDPETAAMRFGDNYQARYEIGRGAMGVVYAGVDLSLERQVAIKVLQSRPGDADVDRRRFTREARILAALDHPNIVPIYAFGQADDRHYFVMKLMSGESVRSRLQAGDDPWRLLTSLQPIAEALDYAHSRGVVHRDLKPANILYGRQSQPMLVDFGVSFTSAAPGVSMPGQLMGTPTYLAPEQARPDSPITGAVDQYALGILAFEVLSGSPPFQADSIVGTVSQQLNNPPPSLRERNPDVPERVQLAIERALEKKPADRYPSCEEFYAELLIDR